MSFWNIYKFLITVLLIIFTIIIIMNTSNSQQVYDLAEIYIKDCYSETGTTSVVAGIYLDYRLYDSLFEALLLLVGVGAIAYLNRVEIE